MGATLNALHRLQQLELELLGLRQKIETKHRAVRGCKKRIQDLDQMIAARKEQLKRDQVEADRAELERKSREQEIARLREALNRSKTNKEYSAVLTQLNTDKADNAKREEQILAMYAALDQTKAAVKELEETRAREVEKLRGLESAAVQFEASVKRELESLQAKREDATERIPPDALRMFERVASKHDGEAMAQLSQVNPRREEFVCDGCNMTVTLEQISALRGRDEIQTCNTCGRILYIEEAVATRPT
jgi:predicted  nucleic acid-binding Zn-ribbon protein